ncbi:hypothetical protein [Vibrio sp. THAF190c]|uniref:hypothetical protein n=1 Tax=Vibrio sp. THAF190c TaxID=2587865 RepID=UPI0012686E91|nr:hypothetical protein [Vibrio sp. THAF190c]QFT13582.1 hypothetical protein FIV04_26865 [Vibrio sp. THAF190c]
MSCSYVGDLFLAHLKSSLSSIAYSGKLHDVDSLRTFLASLDPNPYCGSPSVGVLNLIRLFHVANHRAYRLRYPHKEVEAFQSYKRRDPSVTPTNHRPKADYKQIVATVKAIDCLIDDCNEDGEGVVPCDSRKCWAHFLELHRIMKNIMIQNCPEYQSAQWRVSDFIEWEKMY